MKQYRMLHPDDLLLSREEASNFAKLVIQYSRPDSKLRLDFLSIGICDVVYDRQVTWSVTSSFKAPHNNTGVVIRKTNGLGDTLRIEGHRSFVEFCTAYYLNEQGELNVPE